MMDATIEEVVVSPRYELVPQPARAVAAQAAEAQTDADEAQPQPFRFTGTGAEYFRIWVVNLLLTVLTLGVYSAWAKVRRLQYFYRNTRVGGTVFDYHGTPKAILKGRILALVLVAAYQISFDVSAVAAIVVALVISAIVPWLLARAFRFKMGNSSYRGVRFHFCGTVGQAYRMLIIFPVALGLIGLFIWSVAVGYSRNPGIGFILLVGVLPLAVLACTIPLAHYCLKRYQHGHADFGQTPFHFHARPADFFKIYGKAVAFLLLGTIPAGIFGYLTSGVYSALIDTAFGWLFGILYGVMSAYASYLFVRSYLESRVQNLVWNQSELGEHRFSCDVKARKLVWIHATNLILIALTLGLYKPFAAIRIARYRVESMTLLPAHSLDEFFANPEAASAGAVGQEAGDLFNIDIAL